MCGEMRVWKREEEREEVIFFYYCKLVVDRGGGYISKTNHLVFKILVRGEDDSFTQKS